MTTNLQNGGIGYFQGGEKVDSPEYTQLGQKKEKYNGDFVLTGQTVAAKEGFSHVSRKWYEKCMTFDTAMDKICDEQRKIHDYKESPLKEWEAVTLDSGEFALKNKVSGQAYKPNKHALTNIGIVAGVSTFFLNSMVEPKGHATKKDKMTGEPIIEYNRDKRDSDVLVHTLNATLFASDRVDQDKPRLWRTWNDGTLRALLSNQYAIINNQWFMDAIRQIIPGGLVSHWRGDADAIYGNILIPDSIRAENDSDYGGMLSIGNSEIGTRKMSSTPSVFRAICMNGCIWDQEKGIQIKQMHKGSIDLELLKSAIADNLTKQIPLLNEGIERILHIKAYGCGDTPILNVFGETASSFKISPKQIQGVMREFEKEVALLDKEAFSAFGVQAALTRYGQTQDNDSWLRFDEIAGEFANLNDKGWSAFIERAKHLDNRQLEKVLGLSA